MTEKKTFDHGWARAKYWKVSKQHGPFEAWICLKIIISNSLYLRLRVFSCRDFLWKEKTTFWEQKLSKTTKLFDTFMFLTIRRISKHSAQTIKSLSLFYLFSNLSVLMDFCSDLNWASWQLLEFAPVPSCCVINICSFVSRRTLLQLL